jgi:hypothetical protein
LVVLEQVSHCLH